MPARIKFWLFGTAFTLSTIVSPLLVNTGGVTAAPAKETKQTKQTKQPNLIDRLIFRFKSGEKPDRPRASASGDRRTRLAGGKNSSTNCEADIVALMPKYNLGVTMTDTPTFWFYIPPSSVAVESLKFSLVDDTNPWETQLITESKQLKSGLFKVQYQGKPLIESSYQWKFSYKQVGCRDTQTLSGEVRKEVYPNLVRSKNPREQLRIYAQNGIWHELLTELITLRQQQPKNLQLAADFRSLFFDSEDLRYLSSDSIEPDLALMGKIVDAQVIN
jgi:hypothetical protein